MSRKLLLEIGTEEIPARFMRNVLAQMQETAEKLFEDNKIEVDQITVYGTPRRLVLMVDGVAQNQKDTEEENRGPSISIAFDRAGHPTKAVEGFARGQGVEVSDLVQKDGYVFARKHYKGQLADDLLPSILEQFIQGLTFPKSMKWGMETMRFVRPIRWIVALLDETIIDLQVAGVSSGRTTRGHRFLGDSNIKIDSVNEYLQVLRDQFVIVDQEERRSKIDNDLKKMADKMSGVVIEDPELLEEVVYLVEFPTVLSGSFEEEYLKLPDGAIITPMKDHQRYFPVRDSQGKLLPKFLTVRNGGDYCLDKVTAGNERVLRARLADAEFFFKEDRKRSLRERYEDLSRIVFQDGLGNMQDKTERLQKLGDAFAGEWNATQEEIANITKAIHLSKTDLTTAMVSEFTELQGEIGKEYARLDGEDETVAQALAEQYLPRYSGDAVAQSLCGIVLSLSDKIDNIMATFSKGLTPSGSQDPFALRRQAIGIINTSIENQIFWSLPEKLEISARALNLSKPSCKDLVQEFILQRFRNVLLEKGISHDVIESVFAVGVTDLYDAYLRAVALQNSLVLKNEEFRKAFIRVLNIVSPNVSGVYREDLFTEDAEKNLCQVYEEVCKHIKHAYESKRYSDLYDQLSKLQSPISLFFENIIVMSDDLEIKENRLGLLKSVSELILIWADIRKIVR